MKIRISNIDKRFSKYIRDRDGRCVRCGSVSKYLQNSHFWGRGNKCTRFDPDNCDTLCMGCHSFWEARKAGEYREFKIKQLGKEKYEQMRIRGEVMTCKEYDENIKADLWLKSLGY